MRTRIYRAFALLVVCSAVSCSNPTESFETNEKTSPRPSRPSPWKQEQDPNIDSYGNNDNPGGDKARGDSGSQQVRKNARRTSTSLEPRPIKALTILGGYAATGVGHDIGFMQERIPVANLKPDFKSAAISLAMYKAPLIGSSVV